MYECSVYTSDGWALGSGQGLLPVLSVELDGWALGIDYLYSV
jgi:hypothetical protein